MRVIMSALNTMPNFIYVCMGSQLGTPLTPPPPPPTDPTHTHKRANDSGDNIYIKGRREREERLKKRKESEVIGLHATELQK